MDREPRRRSIRLRGYDYTLAGAYFITVCTQARRPVLGERAAEGLRPTPAGLMVREIWQVLPDAYGVGIDAFVVMPDHIHGILVLPGGGMSLPEAVHRFKSLTTQRYRGGAARHGWPLSGGRLWQRGYYERIVRSEAELEALRGYIAANPDRLSEGL